MSSTSAPRPDEVVKPYMAPYEIKHGRRNVRRRQCQLEAHEILHHIRGLLEDSHRQEIYQEQVLYNSALFRINIDELHILDAMPYATATSYWNMSVPIYLINRGNNTGLLGVSLLNYLYRRWFRPYRSDIEYGQFIARLVETDIVPDTTTESNLIDLAVALNNTICARLDATRDAIDEVARLMAQPDYEENLEPYPVGEIRYGLPAVLRRRHFITRPLFRAMAIVLYGQNYPPATPNPAELSVLVILTGQEEGLSAPIAFDAIADEASIVAHNGNLAARMTLERAVTFIMALEAREEAAFGPQQDPTASTTHDPEEEDYFYSYRYEQIASELGMGGQEPRLTGPSSAWVDTEQYPDWTGSGAYADTVQMAGLEEMEYITARRMYALRLSRAPREA